MPATGNRYARGSKAWGICLRCGLRDLLNNLVYDGQVPWVRVHTGCRDDKHPQERLVRVTDPIALWHPSPEAVYTYPVLSGVQVGAAINLTWTAATFWAGRVESYDLYRSVDGGAYSLLESQDVTYTMLGAIDVEPLTHSDTPVTPAVVYRYRVDAMDVYDRALSSNIVTITAV